MIHACARHDERHRQRPAAAARAAPRAAPTNGTTCATVVSVHSAPRRRSRALVDARAPVDGRRSGSASAPRASGADQPPVIGRRMITSSASTGSSRTCSAWPSPVETIAEVALVELARGTPRRPPRPPRGRRPSTRRASCGRSGPCGRASTSRPPEGSYACQCSPGQPPESRRVSPSVERYLDGAPVRPARARAHRAWPPTARGAGRPPGDLHERHVVAARVGDALDVVAHDRSDCAAGSPASGNTYARRLAGSTSPVPCRRRMRGEPVEGAEHDHDAPVLAQVRRRVSAPLPT